ncbi:MAG: hypothetical protein SCK29_07200 [Bacillota bacterium]|nr:hypothetical protein [Bacillota bacterium]MDW7683886.1 hypothetical protein [Bacillota bacterium]
MQICENCGQVMSSAKSCVSEPLRHKFSSTYAKIPYGQESLKNTGRKKTDLNHRCIDCGVRIGGYHHKDCDQEQCPICGGKRIHCSHGKRIYWPPVDYYDLESQIKACINTGNLSKAAKMLLKVEDGLIKEMLTETALEIAYLRGRNSDENQGLNVRSYKPLSLPEVAEIMNIDAMFLRASLQQSKFPFGAAYPKGERWAYYINPKRFYEYLGIDEQDL